MNKLLLLVFLPAILGVLTIGLIFLPLWLPLVLFIYLYTQADVRPIVKLLAKTDPPSDYSKGKNFTSTKPDGIVDLPNGPNGTAASPHETVIQLLAEAKAKKPNALALRVEREGKWISWTWKQYAADIETAATALVRLGFERSAAINVIGFNSPEWFISMMGSILAGGKCAGIYTTNKTAACKYVTKHSEAQVIVVENDMQLKKFLPFVDELKHVAAVVQYTGTLDSQTVAGYKGNVKLLDWKQFMAIGKPSDAEAKDDAHATVQKRADSVRAGECCSLIYTSGTTGEPKAVMISHDNIVFTCNSFIKFAPKSIGSEEEHVVSYLPLSHIAAQALDLYCPLYLTSRYPGSCCVHFARPDALKGTLGDTLRAARPTIFFGVPRVWEKIGAKIQAIGKESKGLKKAVSSWAKTTCLAANVAGQAGGSGRAPLSYGLARLVMGAVKKKLGLDRCLVHYTGAAPIAKETLLYFAGLDINIMELYGMSECTGPQTSNSTRWRKFGSCGTAMAGTEVRIMHDKDRDRKGEGEICFRGRNAMMGYMNNPAKTKAAIDPEGYLHSGDVGKLDKDGFLYITGRIKELIITAGGENIAPVPIEEKLGENCPAISNAMMYGDLKKYNVVLITLPCVQNLETGAFSLQLTGPALEISSAKTVTEAQNDAKWTAYIEAGIKATNKAAVSNAQKIQYFRIVPEFSVNEGDLTPTLKLKRSIVAKKYAKLIESMY